MCECSGWPHCLYNTLTSIFYLCVARFLPEQIQQKKTKVILCLRNPKDAAVSYYNHMRAMAIYQYKGEWKNWVGPYVRGQCVYLYLLNSCLCASLLFDCKIICNTTVVR